MKLLLDTHVWLWSQLSPEKLSKSVKAKLTTSSNELWLSPISMWEVVLLTERGRLRLRPSARGWIETFLAKVPVREAPLVRDVALASRDVVMEHDDPADRFLAATASVYELTLVTADERLLRGKGYKVLAAG
jgi:PIN domain nuclease of toxin-antitoxin system